MRKESNFEGSLNKNKNMEINVESYTNFDVYDKIIKNVEETNRDLDYFIEKLKKQDEKDEESNSKQGLIEEDENMLKKSRSRSESVISKYKNEFSFETLSLLNLTKSFRGKSFSSINSIESSTEFSDLDLHSCCANSFNLDSHQIPSVWHDLNSKSQIFFEKSLQLLKIDKIEKVSWRNNLLNEIINRNLKEYVNIDKVSIPYENDVKLFILFLLILDFI